LINDTSCCGRDRGRREVVPRARGSAQQAWKQCGRGL